MGSVLTWNGRQLTSNGNVQYIYDASGLRTVKYDANKRTEYTYVNGKLTYQETTFTDTTKTPVKLFFCYDSYGNLTGIKYNDAMFYAATNSQGDVIAIYHANGTVYARYEYDAWGNILSITDANGNAITSSTHIANVNPIRYRGYVYDTDTGLYYLQSRYYDSEIGRFINADGLIDGGAGVRGNNIFMYCANNPVIYTDSTGAWIIKDAIKLFSKKVIEPVVEKTKEVWSDITEGTVSREVSCSGTVFVQVTGAVGIAYDESGGVAIYKTNGVGIGTPSASISTSVSMTNAPSVQKLEGESCQIGGSVDVDGVSIGAAYSSFVDDEGNMYEGFSVSTGIGLPMPADAYVNTTETEILCYFNIFSVAENLCYEIEQW